MLGSILYLGFFWRRKNSHQGPHLKIKWLGEGFYFSHYAKMHYDSIWANASSLDFTDPGWESGLGRPRREAEMPTA